MLKTSPAAGRGAKTATLNMTTGPIIKLLITFAIPLLFGNLFQMLYNTVDLLVVGNFVGKEALAAVGSSGPIVNMQILFFNGVSVGMGVIISRYFGAGNTEKMKDAIYTAISMTFMISAVFTVIGVVSVPVMLRLMSTPDDVYADALLYLRIYFAGISGLLVYNIGSEILRAVGDTRNPLFFLILTSLLNIVLDLTFVLVFHLGIAGVAIATILSQFISALLVMLLLTMTKDIYRISLKKLHLDTKLMREMLKIGLPVGLQAMLTALSNVVVQSYINAFGSACMAGWAIFLKVEQFVFLPMSSLSAAGTTFVSQNFGAGNYDRVNRGTWKVVLLTVGMIASICCLIQIFDTSVVKLFTRDAGAVWYSAYFVRIIILFITFNTVNHVLAGALRGRGDSFGPMVIMTMTFIVLRQIYLFIGTRLSSDLLVVALAYPVGWVACCICENIYFYLRWARKKNPDMNEA